MSHSHYVTLLKVLTYQFIIDNVVVGKLKLTVSMTMNYNRLLFIRNNTKRKPLCTIFFRSNSLTFIHIAYKCKSVELCRHIKY